VETFRYRATDATGARQRGVMEGSSSRAVRTALVARGLMPTSVSLHRGLAQLELRPQRVSPTELMHLSRQLTSFLRAGIPILEALWSISSGTDNRTLRRVLREVCDGLRAGQTLSQALDEHPEVFPSVYRAVLRTAELTGEPEEVLDQLADYLERDLETRRQIRSAAAYPIVIFVMAILTVVVITVFVMPRFEIFFASLDATLPLPTRMLLGTTGFLARWWYLFLAGFALLVVGGVAAWRSERGRAVFDRAFINLPVIGETLRCAIVERFCRTLGAMVSAGVGLSEAMGAASATTNNVVYTSALEGVHEEMVRGEGIAGPIESTGLFPSAVIQMMRAGEKTGTLHDQLAVAATYFERELRFRIKNLTTIFEPMVILVVGGIVGFVALALVSAMYGIFNQVGGV
jgi:type IV pilus assembly protein PilC